MNKSIADPEITPEEAFALILETACEDFENMLDLLDRELQVVVTPPQQDAATSTVQTDPMKFSRRARAPARIQMALAKSFLFNARRANRICEKNKAALALARAEREQFMNATKPLIPVRDVNEHGFDGDKRSEKNKPQMHDQDGARLDETALTVDGRDRILMGPLNLYTIYLAVNRMREIAGFQALHKREIKAAHSVGAS